MNLEKATQITDYVYLGSINDIHDKFPQKNNIGLIINFAKECVYNSEPIHQKHFNFIDSPEQNLSTHFDRVVEIINEYVNKGEKVFIHCVAGKSRSVSFVLAYLIKEKQKSLNDAFNFVKNKRNTYINMSFMKQLQEYEKIIYNLDESTIDYDDYLIEYIADTVGKNKQIVSEIYFSSDKKFDITINKLFK